MKRLVFAILLCTISVSSLQAQNAIEDLTKVYENYMKLEHFDLQLKIDYFNTYLGTVNRSEKGHIVCGEDAYYFSMSGRTVIQKGDQILMIDEDAKSMMLHQGEKGYGMRSTDQYKATLKQLMEKNAVYKGDKNGLRTYRYKVNRDMITSMDIVIDMTKMELVSVTTFYNQEDAKTRNEQAPYKVRVDYQLTKKSSPPSKEWFNIAKYVIVGAETVNLTSAYSHYQLYYN